MSRPIAAAVLAALLAAPTMAQQPGGGKAGNRPAAAPAPAAQGAPAASKAKDATAPDPETVKTALHDFHAGWAKASLPQRVEAVDKLASVGGPAVADALAQKLHDPSPVVRKSIAEALERLHEPKTVGELSLALAREVDAKDAALPTIQAICGALGAIGDAKALPALTHGVFGGNDSAPSWTPIVEARLNAIGEIKDKASVDALIDLFGKMPASGSSRRLAGGLRGGGGNSRVQALIDAPLRKLTRENHAQPDGWRDWWKGARAKFQFR